MGYRVVFTPEARTHLYELEDYLATRFYESTAKRFVLRLVRQCHSLSLAPYRGTIRTDLRPGVRSIGFERRATIYFLTGHEEVVILAITYGGQLPVGLE